MSNLYQANRQWAERPDDERFWSLDEMLTQSRAYHAQAATASVRIHDLSVGIDEDSDNLTLIGATGNQARLTNWTFQQLCQRVGAPKDYLPSLPTPLAKTCLEHSLRQYDATHPSSESDTKLLLHRNGTTALRAITSDDYARIWNDEIIEKLVPLQQSGWKVPPARPNGLSKLSRPATEADCLDARMAGLGIKPGDAISPAGLYLSDHDCFVFMVNEENRVDDGTDGGLSRGFFVSNSEVGDGRALKITKFMYRHVYGNHIVWGASGVEELRIVHRGQNDRRFGWQLANDLHQYANRSAQQDQILIDRAKTMSLGDNRDMVIDAVYERKIPGLTKKLITASYDYAVRESDLRTTVNPRSVWGFTQGITAMSQTSGYADKRTDLDRAAGKLLSVAF